MGFFKDDAIPNIQFINLFSLERGESRGDRILIGAHCLDRRIDDVIQKKLLHFARIHHQTESIEAGTHGTCGGNRIEVKVVYELDFDVVIAQPDLISHNLAVGSSGRLAAIGAAVKDGSRSISRHGYTRDASLPGAGMPTGNRIKTDAVHPAIGEPARS